MILTIVGLIAFILICVISIHYISRAYSSTRSVNADDFNKIALSFGAILTVAWGFFTYGALEQRDKAKAELTDLENRIKDTQSTSFSVTADIIKGKGFYYLTPTVTIKNSSNRAIYINLAPDSLKVTRVVAKGDATIFLDEMAPRYFSSITEKGNAPINEVTVPIGAERKLSYIVSTNYPGMYYISFTAN
ncbi:hypothetical protein, partial [Leclercia adecarboxylata]|uniref:hypothetical protein n=1 Tax=Leclercia adecarboxylata TaxID=83655 RepID=UPI00057ADF88